MALEHEMLRLACATPFAVVRQLIAIGVPRRFLGELTAAGDLAGARVAVGSKGLFALEGTEPRLLLAVREEGELVDVVAISSADHDDWAVMTGAGWCLGHDQFAQARAGNIARLRVHATPFAWLRAGGDGICVIEWGAVALGWLRGLGDQVTLACEDKAAASALAAMLAHGGLPRVAVDQGRMAA